MTLFMAVTSDEYELPIAVATSAAELGRMCGVKANTVHHMIYMEKHDICKSRYKKVEVDDDDEADI